MRSLVFVSAFVFIANVGATWAADTVTVLAPAAAPGHANDPDRVVCQTGPAPTGTRIGATRECHTQREWDRMREEQRHIVESHQTMIGSGGH